jgi:hypothetical protein
MNKNVSDQEESIYPKCGEQRIIAQSQVTQTITHSIRTEIGQASTTQISRHTRVSSRRFTGANISVELQPLNFTGVDRAGVISAWSLGTPDAYLCAIAKLQESGVLSFDNIDILPTDNDGAHGIVNAHTLIENLNPGTMQNDVDDQSKECAPCYDTQCSAQAITEDALQGHSSEQRVGNACTHQRAAGSKKFTITHRSILSRKAEVLDV